LPELQKICSAILGIRFTWANMSGFPRSPNKTAENKEGFFSLTLGRKKRHKEGTVFMQYVTVILAVLG